MKIGIDISQIVYEGTGVARFTNGLVHAICTYDTKNSWNFFFSGFRRKLPENVKKTISSKGFPIIQWPLSPGFLSLLWNNLHILPPKVSDLDWFVTSDWTEPPLRDIRKATVVHDLTYLRYPETVDKRIRKTQEKRLQHVTKESNLIFADSQTTADDLHTFLKIDTKRIVVNYPGVDVQRPSDIRIKKTLKKYGLTDTRFILTVGKLEPRKNLTRLIEAFKKLNVTDLQLVIAGPEGWANLQNEDIKNIKFLGFVADEELYSLYTSCLFFVFPSIWEGFGYPIVEAMKLGTPVVCSNTSSIQEIARDSALLFNPLDTEEMYRSIDRLIQDEMLRKELIKKGLQRSRRFTWKNYYNRFIKAL